MYFSFKMQYEFPGTLFLVGVFLYDLVLFGGFWLLVALCVFWWFLALDGFWLLAAFSFWLVVFFGFRVPTYMSKAVPVGGGGALETRGQ